MLRGLYSHRMIPFLAQLNILIRLKLNPVLSFDGSGTGKGCTILIGGSINAITVSPYCQVLNMKAHCSCKAS